jgi:hypothetical protein
MERFFSLFAPRNEEEQMLPCEWERRIRETGQEEQLPYRNPFFEMILTSEEQ